MADRVLAVSSSEWGIGRLLYRTVGKTRFRLRTRIAATQIGSTLLLKFPAREGYRNPPVRPYTDLVIDGFQSSANDFASRKIRAANRSLDIRGHFHSPGQVKRAVGMGIPTILLFRNPVDVALSGSTRWPWLDPNTVLVGWMKYYSELLDGTLEKCYLAKFEDIVYSLDSLVHAVNMRFGLCLTTSSGEDVAGLDRLEANSRSLRISQMQSLKKRADLWDAGQVRACESIFRTLEEAADRASRTDGY